MKKQILAASVAVAGLAATALILSIDEEKPLETVPYVDPERYLGRWYEIAAFPQRFEKGCTCTVAQYSLNNDGSIKVVNSCVKNGRRKIVHGKAFITDTETNAKLNVQFFWPFKGKYWIIALDTEYRYAMVGHPNREYLWLLSRKPVMNSQNYNALLALAAEKGFDVRKLVKTEQDCGE